jgi:hypothetical protein
VPALPLMRCRADGRVEESILYFLQQRNYENWNPRTREQKPRALAAGALLIHFAVTKSTVQL